MWLDAKTAAKKAKMPKVTITIEDTPDGMVIGVVYDPPIADDAEPTEAQHLGACLQNEVIPDLIGEQYELKKPEKTDVAKKTDA